VRQIPPASRAHASQGVPPTAPPTVPQQQPIPRIIQGDEVELLPDADFEAELQSALLSDRRSVDAVMCSLASNLEGGIKTSVASLDSVKGAIIQANGDPTNVVRLLQDLPAERCFCLLSFSMQSILNALNGIHRETANIALAACRCIRVCVAFRALERSDEKKEGAHRHFSIALWDSKSKSINSAFRSLLLREIFPSRLHQMTLLGQHFSTEAHPLTSFDDLDPAVQQRFESALATERSALRSRVIGTILRLMHNPDELGLENEELPEPVTVKTIPLKLDSTLLHWKIQSAYANSHFFV
jgi:hypothetical protein